MTVDNRLTATLQVLEENHVGSMHLQFVDLFGVLKSVTVPAARFNAVVDHGEWFDGSAVDGFARVLEDDMYLAPDLATMRIVPGQTDRNGAAVARLMCNLLTPDGEPSAGDSRAVLERTLRRAGDVGLLYLVAPEVEFYLFADPGRGHPVPADSAGYFDQTRDSGAVVREEIVDQLQALGVEIEGSHHEVSAGQHEVDIAFQPALGAADAVVVLRATVRAVAEGHGLSPSFMPKPLDGVGGSGMHTHQGLATATELRDLFFEATDPYRLSPTARCFIAGQLDHARGMLAVLAPLVNSYKRLATGFEAPTHVSWAHSSRGAMIRVPRMSRAETAPTRVELRSPDPSCNPYLAFAAMLAAGLDGIDRQLPLAPPLEEEGIDVEPHVEKQYVRPLPGSLAEALDALTEDDVLVDALGSTLVERLVEAKRIEWEQYRSHVSDWELDRYLRLH